MTNIALKVHKKAHLIEALCGYLLAWFEVILFSICTDPPKVIYANSFLVAGFWKLGLKMMCGAAV